MQRKYAHTGKLKAWGTFPDNIQTISIWDDLCAIFSILTLQLLLHSVWQTGDTVLQDFQTIVMSYTKIVLTKC